MAYASKVTRFPKIIRLSEHGNDLDAFFRDVLNLGVSLKKVLLVTGHRTFSVLGHKVKYEVESCGGSVEVFLVSDSTSGSVNKIVELGEDAELIISVGGGKALDVGKMAAFRLNKPFISIPTVLSNDGIASPISVIDGKSWFTEPPMAIFIDLNTVIQAPIPHLRAGVGDLIANLTATKDWELAHRKTGEPIVDMALMLARGGALMVFPSKNNLRNKDFLVRLAIGLIQSGLAMEISGSSRPASGAEHKISHAIDALFRDKVSSLHGEQTALGLLVAAILHGMSLTPFIEFFKAIGLPTKPENIGLNAKEFASAIAFARSIRPERYTILEDADIEVSEAESVVERLADEVDNFRMG